MGEQKACALVSTRVISYVECWVLGFFFLFFQTKNGVMLKIDPPVLFCFLPNAHLNGVMGCVFFLTGFFGSFWGGHL